MRIIRNSMLILLSFTMVLIIPITLLYQSLDSSLLKPYESINYLEKSEINERLEEIIKENIYEQAGIEDNQGNVLMIRALKKVVDEQITSDWILTVMDIVQNSFWDYLLGVNDTIDPVSIQEFSESFIQIAESEIKEIAQYENIPINLLKKDIKNLENGVPKSLDLIEMYGIDMNYLDRLKYYFQQYQDIKLWLYLSIITFIFIATLVSYRLKGFFKWLGYTAITGGVLSLFPIAFKYFYNVKNLFAKIQTTGMLKELEANFINLLDIIINDTFRYLITMALIVLTIGIISLIVSSLLKHPMIRKTERF